MRQESARAGDYDGADRQTASLGGVAVTLFLIVVGLALVRTLHAQATLEDCLYAGRSDCVAVAKP